MNSGRKATHQSHTRTCHVFASYTVFSFLESKTVNGMLTRLPEDGRNFLNLQVKGLLSDCFGLLSY